MLNDIESAHFTSFHKSLEIIERISNAEMVSTVAGSTRKKARIDVVIHDGFQTDFHSKIIKPFITALIKEISSAFDLSDLPILNAFLVLDPVSIPDSTMSVFSSYGLDELKVLHDFYANDATDHYQGRTTRCERLLHCPLQALQLEFGGYKAYVDSQRQRVKREAESKENCLSAKLLCLKANKYSTKKSIKTVETEIEATKRKIKEPVLVEDLLSDIVIEQGFPNIRRLLILYLLIPHTEAVVERGFSRMAQIMTKKRCTLDGKSLDILMRISYRKEPLQTGEVSQIFDIWKGMKERRILSNNF